jgi:hypothetical protein
MTRRWRHRAVNRGAREISSRSSRPVGARWVPGATSVMLILFSVDAGISGRPSLRECYHDNPVSPPGSIISVTRTGSARLIACVAAAELPVLFLIAPALLFPSSLRVLVVLLLLPAWLCSGRLSGRLIPPTPLNLSLLVLLGMVGVRLIRAGPWCLRSRSESALRRAQP